MAEGGERAGAGQRRRLFVLGVAALVLAWLARGVLPPFVIAAVIAYAFSPLVAAIVRRTGLPRLAVVAILYLVALALTALAAYAVAGRLVGELQELGTGGPAAIAELVRAVLGRDEIRVGSTAITVTEIARQLNDAIAQAISTPGDAVHVAQLAGDIALQSVLVLIVTFYLLLDGERFWSFALRFLAPDQRARAMTLADRIHEVLGRWLRGQLALIVLVAVVLYVILGPVLHVPYALALSMLSGVLEVIPLVGPMIAAALAGLVAFSHGGPSLTIVVLALYLVVREVEDQLVMPIVIGRAVHLHPVVTIFAVLVGLSVWGVLGGLLAVPVAAALNVTLNELFPPIAPVPAAAPVPATATPETPGPGPAARRARAPGGARPAAAEPPPTDPPAAS